ncbi:MAG: hypothetical protein GQ574_28910 [Crocinitomix sp.]|nr:hypothetical protein [Crocinitomix sp.]
MLKAISIISLIVFAIGCKKHGCAVSSALNYDPKAKVHDHSCLYESKGGLYWNDATHNNLLMADVTNLTAIFDHDTIFKNADINSFNPQNSPSCEVDGWFQFDRINYHNAFDVGLMILNQDSDTIYAEAVELLVGCNVYEIVIF